MIIDKCAGTKNTNPILVLFILRHINYSSVQVNLIQCGLWLLKALRSVKFRNFQCLKIIELFHALVNFPGLRYFWHIVILRSKMQIVEYLRLNKLAKLLLFNDRPVSKSAHIFWVPYRIDPCVNMWAQYSRSHMYTYCTVRCTRTT